MRKAAGIVLGAAVVAGVAVGGYYLVRLVLAKKAVVDETAAAIQTQLDELDPVSRAATVAKLTADEAKSLKTAKA